MKYLTLRQIWCDAFTPQGLGGGQEFFDPKTPRANPFSKRGEVHAKETRSTGSSDNKVWDAMTMGKAQTIIAKLKPLHRSWGMFAYTSIFTHQDHDRVLNWLWRDWWLKCGQDADIYDYKKTVKLAICVNATLEGTKHAHIVGHALTHTELANKLEVKKQNLKRDGWLYRMNEMGQLLDKVDQDALQPLAVLLKERGDG